jgi:hypothetical protein
LLMERSHHTPGAAGILIPSSSMSIIKTASSHLVGQF